MNIRESIDLNMVLDYFLGIPRDGLAGPIASDDARDAAARLAERATKARVRRAWPSSPSPTAKKVSR